MATAFDELEADFQEYYHLDVMSVRPTRAARLMSQLPRGSRVLRKASPALEWGWSEIYLASAVDALNILVWQNSKQAHNSSSRPKSVVPDNIKREMERASRRANAMPAQQAHDIDEIKHILARPRS